MYPLLYLPRMPPRQLRLHMLSSLPLVSPKPASPTHIPSLPWKCPPQSSSSSSPVMALPWPDSFLPHIGSLGILISVDLELCLECDHFSGQQVLSQMVSPLHLAAQPLREGPPIPSGRVPWAPLTSPPTFCSAPDHTSHELPPAPLPFAASLWHFSDSSLIYFLCNTHHGRRRTACCLLVYPRCLSFSLRWKASPATGARRCPVSAGWTRPRLKRRACECEHRKESLASRECRALQLAVVWR